MSNRTFRRVGLAISLASIVVAGLAAPAAARSQVQISGLLTPDTAGVCTEDSASVANYTVTGSLDRSLIGAE